MYTKGSFVVAGVLSMRVPRMPWQTHNGRYNSVTDSETDLFLSSQITPLNVDGTLNETARTEQLVSDHDHTVREMIPFRILSLKATLLDCLHVCYLIFLTDYQLSVRSLACLLVDALVSDEPVTNTQSRACRHADDSSKPFLS